MTPLLDYQGAADLLGVSKRTVERLTRSNALPHVRVTPRRVRFRQEDVERYAEQSLLPRPGWGRE